MPRPAFLRTSTRTRAQARVQALPAFWERLTGKSDTRTAPPSSVQHVSAAEMLAAVRAHSTSPDKNVDLIIMFTATWCGPCTIVHKELIKLAALRQGRQLRVLALDHDHEENQKLATELGVASLPTLIFIGRDANKPAISTVGLVSASLVKDVLDSKMHVCGADLRTRLRLS